MNTKEILVTIAVEVPLTLTNGHALQILENADYSVSRWLPDGSKEVSYRADLIEVKL